MLPRRYQRIRETLDRRQPDLTVLTEDVHKPHNLSAIIRTCDAVGVFEVHAMNKVVDGEDLPTFTQVAQGSEKWVELHRHTTIEGAIAQLQARDFKIYAAHLSDRAVDYREIDYTQPTAVLMGAERWGVSESTADAVDGHIIIPMLGMVQSLNVSVAAAVVLFEAQRQRLEAGFYQQPRLDEKIYQRKVFEWGYPDLVDHYQERNLPYPQLDEQGQIISES
ncbi:tRNA guanosine-2'-O-methyltransferase [[Leptolyngbya] sp. PCC 7376]|uniref:tRNA (guanosine(18)-2'-O)-methyltransferase TrmH n=1 Tax=[Leptolyngbya] sp. PCC 7376 TaxID=111781 RepID=UPI00029F3B5C|nr:tRNA (guanosine(18)-2'-O)-methyltransferase TrmH [[Leptolyngbya] sp. PCC 7376]AFY37788.1 tRNA guanosine-2'-O-methyltransferase [[Leptolyngbya] sp. PCC 7376]